MKATSKLSSVTPRTIRFPKRLRERILVDADRCGRSFDAQVIAILRRHYGEDVDIAPSAETVLALGRGDRGGRASTSKR